MKALGLIAIFLFSVSFTKSHASLSVPKDATSCIVKVRSFVDDYIVEYSCDGSKYQEYSITGTGIPGLPVEESSKMITQMLKTGLKLVGLSRSGDSTADDIHHFVFARK